MRKITSWLLIFIVSTSLLAACESGSDVGETTTTRLTPADNAAETETSAESDDRTTVSDGTTEPAISESGSSEPVGTDMSSVLNGLEKMTITRLPNNKVEMVLPPELVDEDNLEKVVSGEGSGDIEFESYEINEDGSAAIMMTESQHQAYMDNLRAGFLSMFDELQEYFVTFQDLETNEDMRTFKFIVDKDTWSDEYTEALAGMGTTSFVYQLYDGVAAEDVEYSMEVVDEGTGEVLFEMDERLSE